jgi:hypothetical protein
MWEAWDGGRTVQGPAASSRVVRAQSRVDRAWDVRTKGPFAVSLGLGESKKL